MKPLVARILEPDDARASFVLARLGQPELDLVTWRQTIRAAGREAPESAIIGVSNLAGCFLALLRCSDGQVSVIVASAVLAGEERDLICVARSVVVRRL
ncbi:MAG: hypothetical protein IT556_02415 [Acetobacteraceae bacterium]|nr:hypothetical protein [Acetobacteraceae bacterium]